MIARLLPVVADLGATALFKKSQKSHAFRLASSLNMMLPRAKGWVPRILGRTLYRHTCGTLRTKSGAVLAVVPRSLDSYVSRLNAKGCNVTRCCRAMLSAGDVFFDVGANVGAISLEIAQEFQDELTICAFEPQADLAAHIAISCQLSGLKGVSVYRVLVGEFDGEADFFSGDVSSLASRLSPEKPVGERCPITCLDSQTSNGCLPIPNVLKIDVEGFEMQVFQGMQSLIRTHRPALVFEAGCGQAAEGSPKDILCYLRSLANYIFFGLNDDPLIEHWMHRIDFESDLFPGNYLALSMTDSERLERARPFIAASSDEV